MNINIQIDVSKLVHIDPLDLVQAQRSVLDRLVGLIEDEANHAFFKVARPREGVGRKVSASQLMYFTVLQEISRQLQEAAQINAPKTMGHN